MSTVQLIGSAYNTAPDPPDSRSSGTSESGPADPVSLSVHGLSLQPYTWDALEWAVSTLTTLMRACNEARPVIRATSEVPDVDQPCDVELIMADRRSADRAPVLLEQMLDARFFVDRYPVRR